jgi:hypothetical protein
MITWLFDRCNKHGYLPNLIKDETLVPKTDEWWDLCIKPPFSYEFRFLKYCMADKIEFETALVSNEWKEPAYYPVNLMFWDKNIDYFALMDPDSLEKFKKGKFKFLFYYSEGDDPSIEILDHLNELLVTHDISMDNVRIVTANWLMHNIHPFIYFPDDEVYYRYLHLHNDRYVKEVNFNKRDKKFTCLIRAAKIWRKMFAAGLHDLGLTHDAYFSYTGYQYETPAHDEDDFADWQNVNENIANIIASFELQMPYNCDNLLDKEHNDHKLINKDFFQNAYWNFVVETHFTQHTVFLTEKTFKPILNLQPFIIIGNPGSIKLLQQLGYMTFGHVIDERYDNTIDHKERMKELYRLSFCIADRTHSEHIHLQHILKDTLEFNQKHFLAPKVSRIRNLFNQLEYVNATI